MENENLKEFQKLARMFSRDRIVTPEEIDLVLAGILKILSTFKSDNEILNTETKKEVDSILKIIEIKQKELYEDIKDGKKEMANEHKERCEELEYLIEEFKKIKPKDGLDGNSPDINEIITEVLKQIELPENKTEVIEITGEDIIKQINDLDYSPEYLIDIRRIKGLENFDKKSKKGWIPTVISNAMDLNTSARANGYAIVWDDTLKMHKYSASGGGGGSGTVNAGTQYRLGYYATSSTEISELSAITASRVLVSDTNGLPTHSTVTTTTLGYLDATSSIQTQIDTKITASSSDTLTNKTINASNNTISNLTLAMFAANVIDTDTSLAANSDSRVATQKAIKAYVDSSVTGLLDLKGSTDCSTNPNYPSALKGDAYYVTVAGKIGGASGKTVEVGDVYVALNDNAGGTEASVGTDWFVLNQNLSGVALTSGTLAQFASTTSAQLASVISNETGTGVLVFNDTPTLIAPLLGTPTSGTLTNCTGLPVGSLVSDTSTAIGVGSVELGHATDTTLARVSAGVVSIEGVNIVTVSSTDTLTNKTLTAPKIASGGFIADANGNEQIIFTTTASATNEFTFINAANGNAPQIAASGSSDSNVDIKLVPKGTGIVKGELKRFMVRLADSTTALTTGTSKGGDYRISNRAITVKAVGAYVDTAATGGTLLTIDINEAGTTIISTKITLDASEKTSETAATPPVISDASIAADAIVTFDIDAIGNTTPGTGLVVWVDYVYA